MRKPRLFGPDRKVHDFLAVFFATGFFLSFLPAYAIRSLSNPTLSGRLKGKRWTGAGFIGSLLGLGTVLALPSRFGQSIVLILLAFLFSILVSHRAEKVLGVHDDSRIIIDEWVGMWIACFGVNPLNWISILLVFVLFRLFDVLKGPWGEALQRWPGGWGIVCDDVAAGLLANACARLLLFLI